MNLNFTLSELIYSDTAIKYNINNMADIKSLDCMLNLIVYCLQPIREKLQKPMIITSGYRCKLLNAKIGGVSSSQHTKGQAVDFYVNGLSVSQVINLIKNSDIEYDQLINEYNKWIHISFVKNKNRHQILSIL